MASIFKQPIVEYRLADSYVAPDGQPCEKDATGARKVKGRRVPKGTPGARKVKRKSSKWYVEYRDAQGIMRKRPGYKDKPATEQLAAELERKSARQQSGMSDPFELKSTARHF